MHNNLILGTMNIGYPYTSATNATNTTYKNMIDSYLKKTSFNVAMLDTAYYYGDTKCEQILGEILPELAYLPKISTKVNPWLNNDFSLEKYGQLNKEGIHRQLTSSLNHMKIDHVEVMFLHCPDYDTSFEETLETCEELWRKEKFNYLGISNFSVDQLRQIIHISEREGYELPKYYQGMYNFICRKVEEVFPVLQIYNIDFWAYNPLAGGLLTGKYYNETNPNLTMDSRFKNNEIYQNIFWKPKTIDYLNKHFFNLGRDKCLEISLQWLRYQSKLQLKDRIILGASNIEQLEQNMERMEIPVYYSKKELSKWDNIYKAIEKDSPNYYY